MGNIFIDEILDTMNDLDLEYEDARALVVKYVREELGF